MTSFNYQNTAATSTRLLQRFGAPAVLKRVTTGAYDPSTGQNSTTTDELPTTAAVFAYDQKYIDGTNILQGDQRALLAPYQEPKQGDKLTWQGVDFEVIAVKPASPAGVPVLFEAQIRG